MELYKIINIPLEQKIALLKSAIDKGIGLTGKPLSKRHIKEMERKLAELEQIRIYQQKGGE